MGPVIKPEGVEFASHKSATRRKGSVNGQLERLAKIGCIKEVSKAEACIILPLELVSNSGRTG